MPGTVKVIISLFLLMLTRAGNCETYPIVCYDSTYAENGQHPILMKFVDLESKTITDEIHLGDDGDIISPIPASVSLADDTILVVILPKGCVTKNTRPYGYNSDIVLVSTVNRRIIRTTNRQNFLYLQAENINRNEIFIYATDESNLGESIRGIFSINRNRALQKIRDLPSNYDPNSIDSLGVFDALTLIDGDLYRCVYQAYNYVVKANSTRNAIVDSIRFRYYEDCAQVYAVKDSVLFAFSLNYERHMPPGDPDYKGYGDGWIDANVKDYRVDDFSLVDSLSIPDIHGGEFIGYERANGAVLGDYIVHYFGEAEDMSVLYPAMLFIFDTRTNETTWLRVGWR